MADMSDLVQMNCLEWETEKPFGDVSRKSSSFWLFGFKWNFRLSFKSWYYTIFLRKVTNKDLPRTGLTVTTYIRSGNGQQICRWESRKSINASSIVWKCLANDVHKTLGTDPSHGKWTVVFTFHCDQPLTLHLYSRKYDLSADKCVQASLDMPSDLQRLSGDFRLLLEDETFADVKLRCGDHSISAHRSILAIRSEVFAAMFRNKMAESETGTVNVTDVEPEVLDSLLKYVYCGEISDLCEDTASSLYEASDKYSIHSLKEPCSDWMVRNLTVENCLGHLVVADAHGDESFKERVVDFVTENLESIRKDVWSEFEKVHAGLAISVYRRQNAHILSKQA